MNLLNNNEKQISFIERVLDNHRKDHLQKAHDQAFCIIADGSFPVDATKRKNEIIQEWYGDKNELTK